MPFLGFSSFPELYVYATCVLLGITLLMPLNALTSAPAYMVNYYKYVTGDPNAEPNSSLFWANILTFYNLISVPTQIIVGPTVLTPWARKLSLRVRFIFAHCLMMVEVFVILIMPVGGASQSGAMAAFVIVTIAAGGGKSYLEATSYALVSNMPPKFMSAVMFGCGFSGVIASVIQCIIKASMSDSYDMVKRQAYIYFSLTLCFMVTSLVMAISLRWNSFAQKHVGEYRAAKRDDDEANGIEGDSPLDPIDPTEPHFDTNEDGSDNNNNNNDKDRSSQACGRVILDDGINSSYGNGRESESVDQEGLNGAGIASQQQELKLAAGEEEDDVVRAVDPVVDGSGAAQSSGLDAEDADAQKNMTTSEQLQSTRMWPVVKQIYPMQIACFCVFFVSLFLFPSMVIPIDRSGRWFATIAILCYNCGDATGRLSSSFKFLWPSRKVLLIVSFCRFAFIPLIFLCMYHYIPSHAAPCVIMACVGLTNGFFGATAMVFGPKTPTLKTEGQRVMAGQLMAISLLAGGSAAALLAMLVVIFLP